MGALTKRANFGRTEVGGGERKEEEEEGEGGRWKCTQRRKRGGMFSLGMRTLFCVCVCGFISFLEQDALPITGF